MSIGLDDGGPGLCGADLCAPNGPDNERAKGWRRQ